MRKYIIILLVLSLNHNLFAQKIKVLNFGTFHMRYTPDEYKVEILDTDQLKKDAYEVSKMLSKFNPTIICVEVVPEGNKEINIDYQKFTKEGHYDHQSWGEIALIAFELGKMSGVQKIYGIDEREIKDYNYNIINELQNQVDTLTAKNYMQQFITDLQDLEKLSTIEKLKRLNTPETYNELINVNADILTHGATKGKFEGADEAAKFYHRNLRIYSNLNQIPVKPNDRIFIIMGAAHTAFLNEFLKRSPKYESVDVQDYLK